MSLFSWLGRPLKCKFGGHQLAKNILRENPSCAVIRTICTECDYSSPGVEIKLMDGKIPAVKPRAEVVVTKDPYYVYHRIDHEIVRWCETCKASYAVMPQIYRCIYCKGELVD